MKSEMDPRAKIERVCLKVHGCQEAPKYSEPRSWPNVTTCLGTSWGACVFLFFGGGWESVGFALMDPKVHVHHDAEIRHHQRGGPGFPLGAVHQHAGVG